MKRAICVDNLNDTEMFFLSKAITLLRPSVHEGWPIGHIYPILSFSESIIQKTVDFFEEKFNVSPGQLELLKFIQQVHRIHRNEIDYQAFWNEQGQPDGPLFLFIFMDDYHDQTNWQYQVITRENLAEADLRDDDRERIEAEMEVSPDHRFKLNFLFVEKSKQYPEQKFLMEIWQPMPSDENEEKMKQLLADYATMFQSLRSEPFDIHAHSALVLNLLDSYPGDFLRVALERMSMEAELEPHFLVYSQFMARVADLIGRSKIPEVAEAWRGEEEETMLMMFRMTDAEEYAQYRDTYGPIMRLTRSEITDYLAQVEQEIPTVEDEEQIWLLNYEKRLYERNLELIDEMEEDEWDIELTPEMLADISGGVVKKCGKGCQEEAHDEPWGRCPGMRPMRKWLFGANPVPSKS